MRYAPAPPMADGAARETDCPRRYFPRLTRAGSPYFPACKGLRSAPETYFTYCSSKYFLSWAFSRSSQSVISAWSLV